MESVMVASAPMAPIDGGSVTIHGGVFVGNEEILVFIGIEGDAQAPLPKVVDAGDGTSLLARLGQCWQQHRCQNRNDGDDNRIIICILVKMVYIKQKSFFSPSEEKKGKKRKGSLK